MYEYNCLVRAVTDGDTLVMDIDLGFDVIMQKQSVRLYGIDTPESRTSDKIEKIFGNLSKAYVQDFILACENAPIIKTIYDRSEKFGRICVTVLSKNGRNLNEELIAKNLAVPYMGENKALIREQHLKNRLALIRSGAVSLTLEEAGVTSYA